MSHRFLRQRLQLTQIEKKFLPKRILSMDTHGGAPKPLMVRDIADLLLAKRGSANIEIVGLDCVINFTYRPQFIDLHRYSKQDTTT